MPTLVWKLLRQHISIGQLAGFFLGQPIRHDDCIAERAIL